MSNHSGIVAGIVMLVAVLAIGYAILAKSLAPTVSEQEFRQRLEAPGLMLVKFGAPWCEPCRQIDGQLSQLALSHYGELRIALINIDDEPRLANQYGVRSIPRLMLFRDGRRVDEKEGYLSHSQLSEWVNASENIIYGPASVTETSAARRSNPFQN